MARIIESQNCGRRMIKLSTDDIISVVRDFQRVVPRGIAIDEVRSCLSDTVIYLPEDV